MGNSFSHHQGMPGGSLGLGVNRSSRKRQTARLDSLGGTAIGNVKRSQLGKGRQCHRVIGGARVKRGGRFE